MPITAAAVEANGWVLRLTVTGSPGSFASYALSPDASPRVVLASNHAGFVKSGGTAVAGTLARTLVATRPLRLPVNPASPTVKVIDETDLGGGSLRVRLALSEHVYATDTGLTLAVLAGWRVGEGAASGIAVTNGSTIAAPIPIMRWALAPYDVATGSFRLSLFVASHHPQGFEPVAGVRFTATDGTNTKIAWATTLATDNSLNDNLRCYSVTIDPAMATALTAGLLRCDAEVYPWLGAMRTTDAAGTRSMAALRSDSLSVNAATPFVIGYDPAGNRYSQQWVLVDPANGTATASAAMVATTLAGARAVAPTARPRDISTAIQAGYLANRTLAVANGQAAQTRSVDGMTIVLAAGTHSMGATAITSGIATAEVPLRIIGDPDDGNARGNCLFNLTSAAINIRVTRLKLDNLTLGLGSNTIASSATQLLILDRVTGQGRSGLEANITSFWAPSAASTQVNLFATRTRWWRHGVALTAGNIRAGLLRGCEMARQVSGLTLLKNRFIGNVEDGFIGTGATYFWLGWGGPTLAGQVEDVVLAWNDIRFLRGRAFSFTYLPGATAGTPNPSLRRHAIIGNVMERIGASTEPLYSMGEDESTTMSYNIVEANTHAGERANSFYSDPLPLTLADTNTLLNQAFVNRIANNAYDWLPTKHDDFNDPTSQALRGGSNGYRPQMIEAWSITYGVGLEGNYDFGRTGGSNFLLEFIGRNGVQAASAAPLYANDRSILGPAGAAAAGGGDYRPAAASPLVGRGLSANSDRDFDNLARQWPPGAGAFLASPAPVTAANAVSAQRAGSSALAIALALAPQLARQAQRAGVATVGVNFALAADAARHGQSATSAALALAILLAADATRLGLADIAPGLGWAGALLPDPAVQGMVSTASDLALTIPIAPAVALQAQAVTATLVTHLPPGDALLLAPAAATLTLSGNGPRLFGDALLAPATLRIGPDPRVLAVPAP
ncbi:MAG: hypothetical protein RL490_323 [Pseudomonadota bacterium]